MEEQRCALPLTAVDRVVRAAAVTPLPKVPEIVCGVVNAGGRVIPVVDMRARLGLPRREMLASDVLVLARTERRPLALMADAVLGVMELSAEQMQEASTILPEMPYVKGVAKLEDGLVLIHDLGAFLSLDEEQKLDAAMAEAGGTGPA